GPDLTYGTPPSLFRAMYISAPTDLDVVQVTVGIEGSFYSPPTISAGLNDTVVFVFGGDVHTVTQSTFASPCVQLAGGFNSGFAGR
ncbi:unnamed protein product, partial [Mycena citricolor]